MKNSETVQVMKKDKGHKSKDSGQVEKKGKEHSDREENFEPMAKKGRECECRLSAVSVWRNTFICVVVSD